MDIRKMVHNSIRIIIETAKYLRPRVMSSSILDTLYFQVTDVCNANCVFCGYQYYRPRNETMQLDIFERGVRQYAEMGGKKISLSPIVGEPLLDSHIFERIDIAKKYGIKVMFYTNGILLNNGNNIEKILNSENILKLCISSAGFDPRMYERVMRSKQYDRFVSGVERLLRENNEMENPIDIRLALKPDKKVSEASSDQDLVNKILPHISREKIEWVTAFDNWCGTIAEGNLTGRMILAKKPLFKKKPCMSLYLLMIAVDGKIRACPCRFANDFDDELVVGDLNEKDLKEIWFGLEIKKLRQRFRDGALPEPCKNCSVYKPAREG